ncbi:hypothetical protein [Bacillus sp. Bos-x628]|uniref:hypothetical protein n=1 Tax=Bacillus maqinnsis TaxID=3229854 RepID=UPI00338E4E8D
MESTTYKVLMCLGILVAVAGVIFGITTYDQDVVDQASASKKVYYDNLDSDFAETMYETDKARADIMRMLVILTIGGGIVIGGVLFGIATILKVLINRRDSADQSEKRLQELITDFRAAN